MHPYELKSSDKAQVIDPKQLRLDVYRVHSQIMLLFFQYVIEYWFSYNVFGKWNESSAFFRSFLDL